MKANADVRHQSMRLEKISGQLLKYVYTNLLR